MFLSHLYIFFKFRCLSSSFLFFTLFLPPFWHLPVLGSPCFLYCFCRPIPSTAGSFLSSCVLFRLLLVPLICRLFYLGVLFFPFSFLTAPKNIVCVFLQTFLFLLHPSPGLPLKRLRPVLDPRVVISDTRWHPFQSTVFLCCKWSVPIFFQLPFSPAAQNSFFLKSTPPCPRLFTPCSHFAFTLCDIHFPPLSTLILMLLVYVLPDPGCGFFVRLPLPITHALCLFRLVPPSPS